MLVLAKLLKGVIKIQLINGRYKKKYKEELMRSRKILTVLSGICLVLVLVMLPLMAACAQQEPSPATTPAPSPATTPTQAPVPTSTPIPAPAPEKVWELRMSVDSPSHIPYSVYGTAPWAKMVEEATKGRVKITVYWASTLAKAADTWTVTESGVTDLGWAMTGHFPGQVPLTEVMNLPLLGIAKAETMSRVLWQLYEQFPAIQAEYKPVKLVSLWTTEPYALITRDKPVRTLEDVKGLKLRAAGTNATEMTKTLGAVPLTIPMPDCYLALQKGVFDGMWVSREAVDGFKLYEVTNYFTDVWTSPTVFLMIMNLNKWKGFPSDIQQQIMSVSGEKAAAHFGSKAFDGAGDRLFATLKEKNITWPKEFITPPPAEMDRWTATAGKPIWDIWVTKWKDRGPTQEILNRAVELGKQLSK